MSTHEQLFTDSTLEIATPSADIEFPSSQGNIDEWLDSLKLERQQAFFDEQLRAFFLLRVRNVEEEGSDPNEPPNNLLSFLTHLQISLDASYISPTAGTNTNTHPNHNFLAAPPRGSGIPRLKVQSHPPIVVPNTPNPTPTTTDNDKRYINAEGTMLLSVIWGQKEDSEEGFTLHWSEREHAWVAVYQLTFTVAFLRLTMADPLLCLTVSATLRDKPITSGSTKHPLAEYLARFGSFESSSPPVPSDNVSGVEEGSGMEEVNLLGGLAGGLNFQSASLPSARLGAASRYSLFSLAPVTKLSSPVKASPTSRQSENTSTLRKSFRKTLLTASGFRVRMRTTFIPYLFLSSEEQEDMSEIQERTVILCVEIENHGEGGKDGGFSVESINVKISGTGATTTLIGLGDGCFGEEAERKVFPLKLKPFAQVNLLYAVTFLQSPDETVLVSSTKRNSMLSTSEIKRSVVIDIQGRPFTYLEDEVHYPARAFSSRWNCVLDLSPQQQHHLQPEEDGEISLRVPSALPEPPSPFPPPSPRKMGPGTASPPPTPPIMAGKKRHTLPAPSPLRVSSLASDFSSPPSRSSLPVQSNRFSVTRPSVTMPSTPTTFAPPPPPPPAASYYSGSYPSTPAYPNFPLSPTVENSQSPIHSQHTGMVGPAVDIRRARDSGMGNYFPPPTPGPVVGFNTVMGNRERHSVMYTEPPALPIAKDPDDGLVVSIGLVQPGVAEEDDIIRVMEQFTLDVFVFNRTERTTRLEISYPRSKVKERGILAVDNRVRIGPLRPMTCQAVRMRFLALTPGVHTIDALTLTNTETGRAINLRNVLDIVVHEPEIAA